MPLPSGLSGFQRAMAHQYCDELCVANESRGEEPNRSLTLYKKNDANESAANKFKRELGELLKTKNTLPETQDSIMLGVPGWKDRYYKQKMPENDDDEGRQAVARSYVEGLCWVMRYYYDGCQSWKWFFPYHYAPFAADIANAITPAASGGDEVVLEAGAPFAPFQQLMAVLPPRSSHALPAPFAELMTDPSSEIGDFYPTDFAIDINGKKFAWQAVVLLPFIDEERLLDALETREDELSEDEKRRNSHGVSYVFVGEEHALCGPISTLAPPDGTLTLAPEATGRGLGGAVTALPEPVAVGASFAVPEFRGLEKESALVDFNNRAVCARYALPPWQKHVTKLLDGVVMPPDALGEHEGPTFGRFMPAKRGHSDPSAAARMVHGALGGGGDGGGYRRDTESDGGAPLSDEPRVLALIAQRAAARQARDFGAADRLRDELRRDFGVEIDDNRRAWRARPAGGGPPRGPGGGGLVGGYAPPPRHPPPQYGQPQPGYGRGPPPGYGGGGQYGGPPPGYGQYGGYGGGGPGGGGGPHRGDNRGDGRYHPYARPPPPPPQHNGGGGYGGGPGGASSAASQLLRQQLHQAQPGGGGGYGGGMIGGYAGGGGGGGGYGGPPPGGGGYGGPPPGGGYPGGGGYGAPPPPPHAPPRGGTAEANRSAAELLREQMRRR